jgi:hypothetical protein
MARNRLPGLAPSLVRRLPGIAGPGTLERSQARYRNAPSGAPFAPPKSAERPQFRPFRKDAAPHIAGGGIRLNRGASPCRSSADPSYCGIWGFGVPPPVCPLGARGVCRGRGRLWWPRCVRRLKHPGPPPTHPAGGPDGLGQPGTPTGCGPVEHEPPASPGLPVWPKDAGGSARTAATTDNISRIDFMTRLPTGLFVADLAHGDAAMAADLALRAVRNWR